ncbi:MAG TPA: amino acid ABC transporter substrate-binding protein [Xanthobacteraceae bacterium]
MALLSAALVGHSAFAQPAGGRLKRIQEAATIKIAYRTDSRPFSFLGDRAGHPTGYTIELCTEIAKSIERQLGLAVLGIQWVPVDTQNRFEVIVNGSADMECGSTTVSLSRLKLVDFSSFVYVESTGVLVNAGAGLFSFNDLAGKKIGVVPGSTNAQAVRDQLERRKLDATLISFTDRRDGVAALARGELDGFASDKLVLLALAQAANLQNVAMLPEDLSFEPFAIMLPRGDVEFRLAVNAALARFFRSGEILALHSKYFGTLGRQSSWTGAVFTFGGLPE